jgi:hypothetical protein
MGLRGPGQGNGQSECVSAAFRAAFRLRSQPRFHKPSFPQGEVDCSFLARLSPRLHSLRESVEALQFTNMLVSPAGVAGPLQARRLRSEERRRRSEGVRGLVRGLGLHPPAAAVRSCHGETLSAGTKLRGQAIRRMFRRMCFQSGDSCSSPSLVRCLALHLRPLAFERGTVRRSVPTGSSVVRPYTAACSAGSVSGEETVARANWSSSLGQGTHISLLVPAAESFRAEASVPGRLFVQLERVLFTRNLSLSVRDSRASVRCCCPRQHSNSVWSPRENCSVPGMIQQTSFRAVSNASTSGRPVSSSTKGFARLAYGPLARSAEPAPACQPGGAPPAVIASAPRGARGAALLRRLLGVSQARNAAAIGRASHLGTCRCPDSRPGGRETAVVSGLHRAGGSRYFGTPCPRCCRGRHRAGE